MISISTAIGRKFCFAGYEGSVIFALKISVKNLNHEVVYYFFFRISGRIKRSAGRMIFNYHYEGARVFVTFSDIACFHFF